MLSGSSGPAPANPDIVAELRGASFAWGPTETLKDITLQVPVVHGVVRLV